MDNVLKLYDDILLDENLNLKESILMCLYIERHVTNGLVTSSDTKDAEYLKIGRKYVGKKRKHLELLGYINCKMQKGRPTIIEINNEILKRIGL